MGFERPCLTRGEPHIVTGLLTRICEDDILCVLMSVIKAYCCPMVATQSKFKVDINVPQTITDKGRLSPRNHLSIKAHDIAS